MIFTKTTLLSLLLGSSIVIADDGQRGIDNPHGSTFTYQGQLNESGSVVDGLYDMRFSVFSSSGVQIHSPVTYIGVNVSEGLFTVDLDFDESLWVDFAGTEKFLQIEVRANGGGSYTALAPRTRITSSPHANVAQRANALTFPYVETIEDFGPDDIAFDLSVNDGTALRLHYSNIDSPGLIVEGDNPRVNNFFEHTAVFNNLDSHLGLVSVSSGHSLVGYNDSADGLSAVLAEVGFAGGDNTSAVAAFGKSTTTHLARGNYAGLFTGDVHVGSGDLTKDYGFSPAPVAPIAYGFVSSNGTISNATSNMSVSWDSTGEFYILSISSYTPSFGNTTAMITVVDSNEPRVATTNIVGGDLRVYIWDINSGNVAVQDNFQVVIYQANDTGSLRSPVPANMNPEQFYNQSGTPQPTAPYNEPIEMPERESAIQP